MRFTVLSRKLCKNLVAHLIAALIANNGSLLLFRLFVVVNGAFFMKTMITFMLLAGCFVIGFAPLASRAATPVTDYFVYLPMTSKSTGSSPSVVVNGDFEAGRSGWVEFEDSTFFDFPLIVNRQDLPSPIRPYDGDWVAWLGGESDFISYIEQVLTIPQTNPQLTYWHWIDSIWGFQANTYGGVYINGTSVDQYPLDSDTATGGWVKRTVDLNAYAGQTVTLRILSQTGTDNFSSLYVDAVSIHSSP